MSPLWHMHRDSFILGLCYHVIVERNRNYYHKETDLEKGNLFQAMGRNQFGVGWVALAAPQCVRERRAFPVPLLEICSTAAGEQASGRCS